LDHLTQRAVEVLQSVDTIAGYTTYIDLIRPLIKDKHLIRTPMTKEVQRVQAAIDIARSGRPCAIVSSGDPGIYAMAGLVFEVCKANRLAIRPASVIAGNEGDPSVLEIEVVPGIPALCAGASLLGAPLAHDFAAVSLSDLLTPWEIIEKRLRAAAEADFVIVLYNPKSKRRSRQLETAQKIILQYRDRRTPVGVVTGAMRQEQDVQIIPLEELHRTPVGMQTTVFIGSRSSLRYLDYMVTLRGYSDKYVLEASNGASE
jgi:precorrin-3B C17-methyltransferase